MYILAADLWLGADDLRAGRAGWGRGGVWWSGRRAVGEEQPWVSLTTTAALSPSRRVL